MKRSVLAVSIVAIVALASSACSAVPDDGSAAAQTPAAPTEAATTDTPGPTAVPDGMGSPGVGDGVFPRTVGHFAGSTEVTAEPKRIVVIATGQLDAVLTLGVVPVGVAYGDGAALVPEYVSRSFPEYADQMSGLVDVGNRQSVNLEAIAAVQPDLILANAAASEETYPTLAAIAPTVLTEGTGVNWKQDFLLLADALGRTQQAQRFLDDFADRARDLGTAVATDSPTVSFVRFTAERARVFGVPSFAGFIAWDAGLARPASQHFDKTSQDFSEEEIGLADAEWIFVSSQAAEGDARARTYTSNPLWAGMNAVSAGHVVDVEDDPWYLNAGPTAATIVLDKLTETLTG